MYRAYDLSSTDSTVCDIERVPKKVMVFRGGVLHRMLDLKATGQQAMRSRAGACESVRAPSIHVASRAPLTRPAHVSHFAGAGEFEELVGS